MNPLQITTEEIQGVLWDLHVQNIVLRREIVALRAQLQTASEQQNGASDRQSVLQQEWENAESKTGQR